MDANAPAAPAACTSGTSGAAGAWERRLKTWLPAALAFLIALTCLRIPQNSLTTGLDDSWGGVLVYAHEHGLQFGTDIVFTYGPLGIFSIPAFSPDVAVARMIFEVLQAGMVAAGACLLAWRMTPGRRAAFLAVFVLMSVPVHWGGDDLLVDLGLLVWGMLCRLESIRRPVACAAGLVIFAGVCALIKFTLLVVGSMTIVLLACDLALRGRRNLAAAVTAGFVLVFLAGWSFLGQKLSGLAPFLRNSLTISGGYNQAMGIDGSHWLGGLLIALAALAAAGITIASASFTEGGHAGVRRGLLLTWLAGLLFLEWKYGFVRADVDHTSCFLGFAPMIALSVAALSVATRRLQWWQCATAAVCVVLALIMLHDLTPGFPARVGGATARRLVRNVGSLLRPFSYLRSGSEAWRQEQSRSQLPKSRALIGRATVDVFGQNQMFAIFNDFNYQPRPVFQSYSAYNQRLMELNGRFYNSAGTPEFVLFNLNAIDGRFPALEDAQALRTLLLNYRLAGEEGDLLLLRHKQAPPPQLALAGEGDVSAGEAIRPADYGDSNLWLEIDLKPSLPGAVRQTLYKPPAVWLEVRNGNEKLPVINYTAPACMLAAGFLASPGLFDNRDVVNFLEGGPLQRPAAFSVELPPGTEIFWQAKIHYRVYRIIGGAGG
jgi:hypothetical protein